MEVSSPPPACPGTHIAFQKSNPRCVDPGLSVSLLPGRISHSQALPSHTYKAPSVSALASEHRAPSWRGFLEICYSEHLHTFSSFHTSLEESTLLIFCAASFHVSRPQFWLRFPLLLSIHLRHSPSSPEWRLDLRNQLHSHILYRMMWLDVTPIH